jgi:hypothetical protein
MAISLTLLRSLPVGIFHVNQSITRTATGRLISNEGVEVPIAFSQNGSNVSIDIRNVGSSYTAKLNAERTEMEGTWSQARLSSR